MKKIFLYAYDRINLGDDLFLYTIANRYPKVKFYLWSNKNNRKTFKSLKKLKVLAQDSGLLKFLNKIHPSLFMRYKMYLETRCDAVVYIGGSIFIEYDNWENILTWWDYEAKNRNFYILGANFGPYHTEAYRNKLARIFDNADDVCFRDKYSENLFQDCATVRYAPDILLDYEFPIDIVSKKQIFISVIECRSRNSGMDKVSEKEKMYLNLLAGSIKDYISKGYKVVLASFCTIEGDEKAVEKIIDLLPDGLDKSLVSSLYYDGTNVKDMLSAIAESELVIASRFHAAILGFAANKPVFPLIYSNKTLNILKDFKFKGEYLDIRELTEDSYINIESDDYEVQKLSEVNQIKNKSKEHFLKLDKVLE